MNGPDPNTDPTTGPNTDAEHIRAALALARRNLGSTWPNPSVGCVIVQDGQVVGRGTTAPGGRPHAEVLALAMAGDAARGATAHVTLEPCSHHGQTPPCADALIAAGIARVVVAAPDPDPRVDGRGLARLRAAGLAVTTGVLQAEAEALQRGFLTRVRLGRPMVTLKLASTLDGRIATATGQSQWITGPAARRAAHMLRATYDAVMAGIGTVRADDPALTCRLPGVRTRPLLRLVVDTNLSIDPTAQLVATAADSPTWLLHQEGATAPSLEGLPGLRLIAVPGGGNQVDMPSAMAALGEAGLTRVLVEGGAALAASLLRAGLVDRLAWFHAPGLIGSDGLAAVRAFGMEALADMPRFHRTGLQMLGPDVLTTFER